MRLVDADAFAMYLQLVCKGNDMSPEKKVFSANGIIHMLQDMPTADAPKGHWEYGENEYGDDGYYCSACHGHVVWKYDTESVDFIKEYNYCPFCRAKMDEVKDGSD